MKAIYRKPETKVVVLQMESLMNVVSNGDNTITVTGGGDFDEETTEKLSRHTSLWDDDDDEY